MSLTRMHAEHSRYNGALAYVPATLNGHHIGTVSPHDFPWLADRSGVVETLSSGTGLQACIAFAKANNYRLEFNQGTYKFSTPIVIDWSYADITFRGKVNLVYTGGATAAAISIDGGAAGFLWRVRFGANNKPLITATNATAAVWVRSMHHGHVEYACNGAATTVLQANFSVCTEYSITASTNEGGWVTRPVNGMKLDARAAGEGFADCLMYNCIIEGVSGDGVISTFAQDCTWVGGTSEGNGGKGYVELTTNSAANTLIGFDCESNTGLDFDLQGQKTKLINCVGSSPSQGVQITGNSNHIWGGRFSKINVAGGVNNILENFDYLDTINSGGFTDSGSGTVIRDVRVATQHSGLSRPNQSRPPRAKIVGPITVTAATKATQCVVTLGSVAGLDHGDSLTFTVGAGMTQLNGNTYQVEPTSDFSNSYYLLLGGAYVDSTAFGTFTAGTATQLAFSGAWAQMVAGFREAYYLKDSDGFVHLGGSIKSGVTATTAFTLPAGYRPAATVVFATANFNVPNTSFIQITSAGAVIPNNAVNTNHISLDGIIFKAEQ